jgi:hypothetical protein
MKFKGSLPLSAIAVPLFALYASVLFELMLQLSALLSLSLSLGVSLTLPTIALSLSLVATLIAQFQLALGLSLPSFNVAFAASIDFELGIVLGLLAELEALLEIDASLIAYGWFGSAAQLGPTLASQLASTWPDGTKSDAPITAYLFVATVSGPYSPDEIESLGLVAPPATPPTPTDPAPPAGAYPPPQAYERGLAGVTISAPTGPGGTQATGSLTVDDSVATGIGKITGISIDVHGRGYTSPPTVSITDTVPVTVAAGTPVVLTLPQPLSISIGQGFGCSVKATGSPTITGPANAKVLTATTVALYSDTAFTQPISGAALYTDATLTGGGTGAAAIATMGGGPQNAIKALLDGLQWPDTPGVLAGGTISFFGMMPTIKLLLDSLHTELKARASLLGGVSLSVDVLPPSISASLDLLAKISANLSANLNVKLPDLTVSAATALDGQISAVADLTTGIGLFMGLAGVTLEVYEYQGPGSQLGAAIANGPGALGWHDGTPANAPVVAAVFGLTNPASVVAFDVFFAGAA